MQMTAICPMTALILKAAARIYAKIKDSSGIEFPINLTLLVVNATVVMLQLTVQANNTRELFGTFSLIRCWWNFVLVSTGTQDYDAHERFKRSASIPTLDRSPTVVRCTMYIWIVS